LVVREVLNGAKHVLRTDCECRYLPKGFALEEHGAPDIGITTARCAMDRAVECEKGNALAGHHDETTTWGTSASTSRARMRHFCKIPVRSPFVKSTIEEHATAPRRSTNGHPQQNRVL
jgi:hypothetical protein